MFCEKSLFGKTNNGENIELITLTNNRNVSISVINYGATLVSIRTPDKDGEKKDIILSFNKLSDYEEDDSYIGKTVGRYANRIAKGCFELDGKKFQLAINNGPNHLHGGEKGFSRSIWDFELEKCNKSCKVVFTYTSPDNEDGYPGNVTTKVEYILDDENQLTINYSAKSDKRTIFNMTNHSYWNLNGAGSGDILDHVMKINADCYIPVDENLIPTGEIAEVKGTGFDFTKAKEIGKDIKSVNGYDHCFAINGEGLRKAVEVFSPESKIKVEVSTTKPGIQIYTANHFDQKPTMNGKIDAYGAFCLETENFPDAPNRPNFPSPILEPNQEYNHTTIYKFSVIEK
ncbi:MAG: galactose mutarotase [Spirochaetales bacterium]|nr:galactose mutarotase [Spirochaetales bacterium]